MKDDPNTGSLVIPNLKGFIGNVEGLKYGGLGGVTGEPSRSLRLSSASKKSVPKHASSIMQIHFSPIRATEPASGMSAASGRLGPSGTGRLGTSVFRKPASCMPADAGRLGGPFRATEPASCQPADSGRLGSSHEALRSRTSRALKGCSY